MANNNQNGKMSREEAGRLGGEATAKNHDKEFYQEIGEKGGEATSKNHGKDFYQEIGEKGGEATSKTMTRNSIRKSDARAAKPVAIQTKVIATGK